MAYWGTITVCLCKTPRTMLHVYNILSPPIWKRGLIMESPRQRRRRRRWRWRRCRRCRLSFYLQGHYLNTVYMYVVALKLHTRILGRKMTLYAKSHSSELSFNWIVPFFTSELWLNLCAQGLFSDTVYAVALKLQTLIQDHYMTRYTKFITLNWNLIELCPFLDLKFG